MLVSTESLGEPSHTFLVITVCTIALSLAETCIRLFIIAEKSNSRNDEGWGFYSIVSGQKEGVRK